MKYKQTAIYQLGALYTATMSNGIRYDRLNLPALKQAIDKHLLAVQIAQCETCKMSDISRGEFFKRTARSKETYTRGEYDHETKKYIAHAESDISKSVLIAGTKTVFIGFDY